MRKTTAHILRRLNDNLYFFKYEPHRFTGGGYMIITALTLAGAMSRARRFLKRYGRQEGELREQGKEDTTYIVRVK